GAREDADEPRMIQVDRLRMARVAGVERFRVAETDVVGRIEAHREERERSRNENRKPYPGSAHGSIVVDGAPFDLTPNQSLMHAAIRSELRPEDGWASARRMSRKTGSKSTRLSSSVAASRASVEGRTSSWTSSGKTRRPRSRFGRPIDDTRRNRRA